MKEKDPVPGDWFGFVEQWRKPLVPRVFVLAFLLAVSVGAYLWLK